MEQRTGPSIQTVHGAAADPAFVPGITGVAGLAGLGPVAPAEPEDSTGPVDAEPRDAVPADAEAPSDAPSGVASGGASDAADAEVAVSEGESESEPEGESGDAAKAGAVSASDGPVFEAADRRARIVADASGVRLALDEESCEFRWDEIGAVETARSRFGKRFTVIVHTPDRRWYPIDIAAPARPRMDVWESELDAVLDAYFDENA
ncbi:hypothetical protein RGF97_11200 [Streptomyces roseicoloratus]|uniref:Uncharacterized protein n=1 Tax=Streptomyces roseicoloratus TaxID=2508722 RepID=A0ABY9RSX8_9ACTN|nr:hypothetical protein [Streptomyces roseicoloratus]WMX45307.1 hypothetical protein RGF97_11200 [Streptomyces roseicoloratus]